QTLLGDEQRLLFPQANQRVGGGGRICGLRPSATRTDRAAHQQTAGRENPEKEIHAKPFVYPEMLYYNVCSASRETGGSAFVIQFIRGRLKPEEPFEARGGLG